MRYRQIEYRSKRAIEVIKCIPAKDRKGIERGERRRVKTREEIEAANMKQAARKLARKLNLNFGPGDYHLILTYKKGLAPTVAEARENLKRFLAGLRTGYKKEGQALKYMVVTEYKNKRIHHHLIINHLQDSKRTTPGLVRALWKDLGGTQFIPLYDSGEYSALAEYLIKETDKTFRDPDSPAKQRYSCSRNLVNPEPEIIEKKARRGWRKNPRPRPGYYIKPGSLYNGYDKMGYPYQRYLLVRLNPDQEPWAETEKEWLYGDYWPE